PARALQRPGLSIQHPDRPGAGCLDRRPVRMAAAGLLRRRAGRRPAAGGPDRRRIGDVVTDPGAPPPTRLVLARHGATEWSRDGRHTGRTDIPLTDEGRVQARRLGDALAGLAFSRVVCSPLVRATETARIAGFTDRIELLDELREWDYGAYEGRRRVDIDRDEPGWTVWSRPIRGW